MFTARVLVTSTITTFLSSASMSVWAIENPELGTLKEELKSLQQLQTDLNTRISAIESQLSGYTSVPEENAVIPPP